MQDVAKTFNWKNILQHYLSDFATKAGSDYTCNTVLSQYLEHQNELLSVGVKMSNMLPRLLLGKDKCHVKKPMCCAQKEINCLSGVIICA